MRKSVCRILSICMIFILAIGIMPISVQAATGKVSLSVSSRTVNIGDTITLTVTGSSDEAAMMRMNVKCEGGAEYIGEGNPGAIFDIDAGTSASTTLKYKATSPGTVTFKTEILEAYTVNEEKLSVSDTSVSVTVKNAATEEPSNPGGNDTPGGNTTPAKSSDNSLKSLTISPGTLSPSFKYSTTKYTATVASNVTSVAVDAQVSNSKATVESVTGNTDLKVGENTIKITVKAENGTIAVYTIIVTRSAGTAENPGETPKPPTEEPEDKDIVIDGVSYIVSDKLPEQALPEEFTKGSVTYNGKEVEAYSFPYQNLRLLYLNPSESSSAASGFYFYNEEQKQFFPYINITVGQIYILVLPTSYNTGILPDGYQETKVTMGSHTVSAYQLATASAAAEDTDSQKADEFYLIYGVDKDGTPGWYQYDAGNMSAQRFNEAAYVAGAGASKDASKYIDAYNGLLDKYNLEKNRDRIIMAALIFALVVAIIVIVNILIFGRKGKGGRQDEDVDYVDLDDL